MTISDAQVEALLAPLDPSRIKKLDGNSHLEAWDIRRHLIRVFGWGGWSFEVVSCDCILERSSWTGEKPTETHKGRHTVAYRVVGRLTIHDPDTGRLLATFEDGATGDSQNQPSFGDAHDMAIKTAMSQALKRCAVNLGDRFGLSLYNKGAAKVVVGKSVAHLTNAEHEASEAVEGGELDEQRHGTDDTTASGEPADAPVSADNAQALADKCEALGLAVDEVVALGTGGRTTVAANVMRSEVSAIKKAMDDLVADRSSVPA